MADEKDILACFDNKKKKELAILKNLLEGGTCTQENNRPNFEFSLKQ